MVILIFTLIANLWAAADPVATAIEQAQALALKKNRTEATHVLTKAIETAAPPLRGRGKLIETQNSIAKIFLTDKGQRLYESGQSTMYDSPDTAMNQYREALALEDGNILILDNIARIQLAKQDCAAAEQTLQKSRALYPYASEPALLELRASVCERDFEHFREKLKLMPTLEKNQEYFVQFLTAQDFLQQRLWRKASDLLQKVNEAEPKFPDAYYYLIKAGNELSRDTEAWSAKYVSLCKGVTLRERKHYSLEPQLCAGAKEIEDVLSKKTEL